MHNETNALHEPSCVYQYYTLTVRQNQPFLIYELSKGLDHFSGWDIWIHLCAFEEV